MAEEERKIPMGLIIGGIVVGTLTGLGIYVLTRRRPSIPPPGEAILYGMVTDIDTGYPIEGVKISLDGLVTHTDSNGAYAFDGVEPGTYTVIFEMEGYEPITRPSVLVEGNNELNVQMVPIALAPGKARLLGTVTDSAGQAIINALVKVNSLQTYTDYWGDYEFMGLEARSYTISISKVNYQTVSQTIPLVEGDNEFNAQLVFIPTMEGIEVRWISVSPTGLTAGQQITIQAQVVNISGEEGDFPIIANIDGITLIQTIHLTASGDGSWEDVIFRTTINTPGTFIVAVGDKSQIIEVTAKIVGTFCCPFCGADRYKKWVWVTDHFEEKEILFNDTSTLQDHIAVGHNGGVYVRAATTQGLAADVKCPICKSVIWSGFFSWTEHNTGADRRYGAAILMEHIQAAHGIAAVYCQNVPEGGY